MPSLSFVNTRRYRVSFDRFISGSCFFLGAELRDPDGLLEGTGKFMRHVKLRPGRAVDVASLTDLIDLAYVDMKSRVRAQ